jgi:hypothetical protein
MLLSKSFPQLDSDFTISPVAEVKAAQPKTVERQEQTTSL